jgi:hypothetical protein
MKLAIMQPYFFPYIGYFQLARVVDKFVFYDDVNYINRGWINRNRILINGESHYITVHQKDASQNKRINEIEIIDNRNKLRKTILNAYCKAPYFRETWPLIEDILEFNTNKMSELAEYSVIQTCKYLGINTNFELSSKSYGQTAHLKKEKRLVAICKINSAQEYINPVGGIELYEKMTFKEEGVRISFLKTGSITYKQFDKAFIENLSIIDVMMFNSRHEMDDILDFCVLE